MSRNYHKNADQVVAEGCNARCQSNLLCRIVTTDVGNNDRCDQIRRQFIQDHHEF